MLHIQESLSHNNLLLSSILQAQPIHPQPSVSNSRSTRVIEQLQDKLDSVQREVLSIRKQLESARQIKQQCEVESQGYVESNIQYRTNIQELIQTLETKQKSLDSTKRSTVHLETQVKKLKDEALASRKQLEDLRRKERVLERDRDMAVMEKAQTERQHIVQQESIQKLASRFDREVVGLRQDLETVQGQIKVMTERSLSLANGVEAKIKQRTMDRRQLMCQLNAVRSQMEANTQRFVDQVRSELHSLMNDVYRTANRTDDFHSAVTKCRGEVSGLVARIRAYTAEASNFE
ncbi:hypothetical protein DFQ28_009768 [Apophysomyces sp. BC1034]|nr:hypothetical protein DFQ30_001738 [Apophysomyces sp. BC1015]KAG0181406.1 hypothetical protein DFQ29_008373 [Apophysomyces sp. BC1021]KAG0194560.1 hypothetical protein DFQ28_009768 [Apophysomyces sp. BC1034]